MVFWAAGERTETLPGVDVSRWMLLSAGPHEPADGASRVSRTPGFV